MRCFAEVSVIVHATEDLDLVFSSLKSFFGDLPYIIQPLEGHYGNPLYLITAFIDDCEDVLKKLCAALPEVARLEPAPGREYYVRLDKQKFVGGVLALSASDDVVRIKVKAHGLCG
ncbi:MAG: RNA-binding domain-containing protein [Thermoproteus sp. AZ2]|uniref:RNA-binding domain-containing protein n=1 Tax=Thermoproteus sp. AZ2 TaxID=1609232 RepID=A0ACC6V3M0_9CREN|nr:MAG: exosome protein [Thermoproteus sp. AZ2]